MQFWLPQVCCSNIKGLTRDCYEKDPFSPSSVEALIRNSTHRWVMAVVSVKAPSGITEMSFPCRERIRRFLRPPKAFSWTHCSLLYDTIKVASRLRLEKTKGGNTEILLLLRSLKWMDSQWRRLAQKKLLNCLDKLMLVKYDILICFMECILVNSLTSCWSTWYLRLWILTIWSETWDAWVAGCRWTWSRSRPGRAPRSRRGCPWESPGAWHGCTSQWSLYKCTQVDNSLLPGSQRRYRLKSWQKFNSKNLVQTWNL